MTSRQRNARAAIAVFAGVLFLSVTGGYLLLVHLSLEAAQAGRESMRLFGVEVAHPLVTRVVARLSENTDGPVPAVIRSTLYSKFLLVLGFGSIAALALVFRRRTATIVSKYFSASTHPLNLALFRVVLFGFAAGMFSYEYILLFATLPESFVLPPVGMGWVLDVLPVRPGLATWAYGGFLVATVFAAVGFMTRASAVVAVVLGTYVLGIPNFYGKVDHYNHVIWFMAILAASPAGATFSVDAVIRAWRRGGTEAPPGPAVRYALPLRFVWLLIGISYFFPGLWKVAEGGLAWPLGDTFRTILYRQWAVIPGFQPPFALDRYPVLFRAAASAAVAFELAFVFLIFFPRLRRLAVAAGLAFHNVTGLMMSIWFLPMQVSYASFLDWHRIFHWVGRRIGRHPATLSYNARHATARRLVAATRHLDLFGRVEYVAFEAGNDDPRSPLRFESGATRAEGWRAWLALLPRVPMAVLLAPVLLAMAVPQKLGDRARHAEAAVSNIAASSETERSGATLAVTIVGGLLVVVNGWFGLRSIEGGWPFAAYPTFATVRHTNIDRLRVTRVDADGRASEVDLSAFIERLQYQKFGPLAMAVAETEDETVRREKLAVLHALIVESTADLDADEEVILHFVTVSADPDQRGAEPIEVLWVASVGTGPSRRGGD